MFFGVDLGFGLQHLSPSKSKALRTSRQNGTQSFHRHCECELPPPKSSKPTTAVQNLVLEIHGLRQLGNGRTYEEILNGKGNSNNQRTLRSFFTLFLAAAAVLELRERRLFGEGDA